MSPMSSSMLQNCHQGILELQNALQHLDCAGLQLTQCLVQALCATSYRCVGEVLDARLGEIYSIGLSKSNAGMLGEMESMISDLLSWDGQNTDPLHYGQVLCHISLLFVKLKKQYYSFCHNKMVDLVHALLCLKGDDPAPGEVTKLVLKLGLADGLDSPGKPNSSLPNTPWGSPKTRKSRPDPAKSSNRSGFRIMSLFERKTPPEQSKSSFYVDVEESRGSNEDGFSKERIPTVSVTAGIHKDTNRDNRQDLGGSKHPFGTSMGKSMRVSQFTTDLISGCGEPMHALPFTPVVTSSKPALATEEELESVINLLSGSNLGGGSPMPLIPEVPNQDPLQLVVPQIYRTVSPASDTQLEELSQAKTQVHRRSEGCLDLSGMGRNTWPHQLLQHRASLPSVQIFSASGHRTGYESLSPSPVPGYLRDTPSPGHGVRDLPSPSYFRHDPPSPFRSHHANTLGISGVGMRSHMLSPLQWRGGPPSPGGPNSRLGGSYEMSAGQHGTWPMYEGMSPGPGGLGDSSSWSGLHDCSDLSDDSSTEDQFFAVGKDLSHVIGGHKDGGSSDEDVEILHAGQPKNSSTWPPPTAPNPSSGLNTDLLEPPELYSSHRPIQMQWSDPMSSRSMWPSNSSDVNQKTQSMQGFGGLQ